MPHVQRALFLIGGLTLLFCVPAHALALDFGDSKPRPKADVKWSLPDGDEISATPGANVNIKVHGEILEGWHIYSTLTYQGLGPQATEFALKPNTLVSVNGKITSESAPIKLHDNNFNIDVEEFEKSVTFIVPVKVSPMAVAGTQSAEFSLTYQTCSNGESGQCIPHFNVPVKFSLVVKTAAGGATATKPTTDVPAALAPAADDIAQAKTEGLLSYFLLAMGTGALALLTPCVFPMIPITVSFFTKRQQNNRRAAVIDASVYSLGIILTFTGLGFFFALLFGATGITDFAANPWVNVGVAVIFVLLALSLFGLFEIALPSSVLNRLNAVANKRSSDPDKTKKGPGLWQVLLMGLVFSLTSFTCTVPFVGAVMLDAANGNWLWPLIGMLGFSAVFSAPFFLLALFPAALKSLPKSGGWLGAVKVLMGFLEIAAAMKFLSSADLVQRWGLLTRPVFLAIWMLLAVAAAVYIFMAKIGPRFTGVRVVSALGCFGVMLFLARGIDGTPLGVLDPYVPPKEYPKEGESFESALAKAKQLGKPVFIDFTGLTCTNCRSMETNMFPRPEVAELLKNYVEARLYTDDRKDSAAIERSRRNQELEQQRYNTPALPFYAIVTPDGRDIATFPGLTNDTKKFVEFLKTGLNPSPAAAGQKDAVTKEEHSNGGATPAALVR